MVNGNCIVVGMDDYKITDNDNNIIGCDSLETCIGILLYSEKYRIAGVLHMSIEGFADDDCTKKKNSILLKGLYDKFEQEIIRRNGDLENEKIKYLVIPAATYTDKTADIINLYEYLLEERKYISFSNEELNDGDIVKTRFLKYGFTNCFAFDASVGNFVTKEIFKGEKIVASVNIKNK